MIRPYQNTDFESLVDLLQDLNPKLDKNLIAQRYQKTLTQDNYEAFVFEENGEVVAMMGLWMMHRVYCGKQFEIDHFILQSDLRGSGIGTKMLQFVEDKAKNEDVIAIELNAYVQSNLAHQFYFKHGFKILGFHFHKTL